MNYTDLETSKWLKEIGAPQKMENVYTMQSFGSPMGRVLPSGLQDMQAEYDETIIAAVHTLDSLIEWLPRRVRGNPFVLHPGFSDKSWFAGYGDLMNLNGIYIEEGSTPLEAVVSLIRALHEERELPVSK